MSRNRMKAITPLGEVESWVKKINQWEYIDLSKRTWPNGVLIEWEVCDEGGKSLYSSPDLGNILTWLREWEDRDLISMVAQELNQLVAEMDYKNSSVHEGNHGWMRRAKKIISQLDK